MPESPPLGAPAPGDTPAARVRLTSVAGAAAAACLCASFFLPWVRVDRALADDFHATMERAVADRTPPSDGAREFLALAVHMRDEGGLRGVDVIHWVRASQSVGRDLDRAAASGLAAEEHQRRLALVLLLLYGMALAAFLLAAHFLVHRFRRARAPVLILCILTGLMAVVTAYILDFAQRFSAGTLDQTGQPLVGHWELSGGWVCLLTGGALLTLAGVFGVRARNWFRVYVISGATAAGLALIALRYLETGAVP